MRFGAHQRITYEHCHKMTTSKVMLWCQLEDTFMKHDILQNHTRWKCVVWLAAGANNGQQKTNSGRSPVYRNQMFFEANIMILRQQDAIEWHYPHIKKGGGRGTKSPAPQYPSHPIPTQSNSLKLSQYFLR